VALLENTFTESGESKTLTNSRFINEEGLGPLDRAHLDHVPLLCASSLIGRMRNIYILGDRTSIGLKPACLYLQRKARCMHAQFCPQGYLPQSRALPFA
jgi:hypothetical protein